MYQVYLKTILSGRVCMDTLMEQMYVSIYIYITHFLRIWSIVWLSQNTSKHNHWKKHTFDNTVKPFNLFLLIILPTQMEFIFLQQNYQIIQPKTRWKSPVLFRRSWPLNVQETQAICSLDKVTPVTLAIRKDMRRSFVHHCEPRSVFGKPRYMLM